MCLDFNSFSHKPCSALHFSLQSLFFFATIFHFRALLEKKFSSSAAVSVVQEFSFLNFSWKASEKAGKNDCKFFYCIKEGREKRSQRERESKTIENVSHVKNSRKNCTKTPQQTLSHTQLQCRQSPPFQQRKIIWFTNRTREKRGSFPSQTHWISHQLGCSVHHLRVAAVVCRFFLLSASSFRRVGSQNSGFTEWLKFSLSENKKPPERGKRDAEPVRLCEWSAQSKTGGIIWMVEFHSIKTCCELVFPKKERVNFSLIAVNYFWIARRSLPPHREWVAPATSKSRRYEQFEGFGAGKSGDSNIDLIN